MIKLYVELGNGKDIKNISTTKMGMICTEVYLKEPSIHFDKIEGYEVSIDGDNLNTFMLVFNEEKYSKFIKEEQVEQAKKDGEALLGSLIEKRVLANATDAEAYVMRFMYPEYVVGATYNKGDRFMWEGKFYKVISSDSFKSTEEWKPDISPSLYVEITDPNVEYPEFKQPINTETAYMKDDKITYKNEKYISLIDNNVYSPETYPDSWEKVND